MNTTLVAKHVNSDTFKVLSASRNTRTEAGDEVIPISVVQPLGLRGRSVLTTPPHAQTLVMHDLAYGVNGKFTTGVAHNLPLEGDVDAYKKGELVVISLPSDTFVNAHHALGILGNLPTIDPSTMEDARNAETFTRDYHHQHLSLAQRALGFIGFPTLPTSAQRFEGRLSKRKLSKLLSSLPSDTFGNVIKPNEQTRLVITSPTLRTDELQYLLGNLGELDELKGYAVHEAGVLRDVNPLGEPHIIESSRPINGNLDELLSSQLYQDQIRASQLRGFVRTTPYFLGNGLALSTVSINPRALHTFFGSSGEVNYTQAVQKFTTGPVDPTTFELPLYSLKINNGKVNLNRPGQGLEHTTGIAHVELFETSVDFRRDFSNPRAAADFNGSLFYSHQAVDIFNREFKDPLEKLGIKVQAEKGVVIGGVLLSPITTKTHPYDSITRIGIASRGEYRLAATYLTKD